MRSGWLLFIFMIGYRHSIAQVQFITRVDSVHMVMGDQQDLTITYSAPSNHPEADLHIENLDTCTFLDIVSQSAWLKTHQNNTTTLEKKIRFSIFDEGTFIIPSVYVKAGPDSVSSFSIPIQIQGIEPDSTGLLPIKGIIREKTKWTDYMGWIIAILSLAIIYGIYRYYQYRKRLKNIPEVNVPEIKLLPHEIAIQKLLELKKEKLWEKGEVKEFHVQLTFILREYLEQRYHIPALESTSHEIIRDLNQSTLTPDQLSMVDQTLNIADWVKFAKGNPEENANALAIENTLELVYATQSETPAETAIQNPVK